MHNLPRTKKELADHIDHTNLSPDGKEQNVKETINEAKEYGFRSVCAAPYWVPLAHEMLKDSKILVDTVVGFPLGFTPVDSKINETKWAVQNGANEVDMVLNLTAFKSGRINVVRKEIEEISSRVTPGITKVIIKTPYLSAKEIKQASKIVVKNGGNVVKTCTGFGPRGATEKDVQLIREAIGRKGKIKAAGGISNAKETLKLLKAGADLIGASHGVEILQSFKETT